MTSKRAQQKAKRANDRRLTEALQDAAAGRLDRALRSLDALVRRVPHNARYQYERGRVLEQAGRAGAAVVAYRKALRLVPDHAEAEAALAQLDGVAPEPDGPDGASQPFGDGLTPDAPAVEWSLTVGPNWEKLLAELDARGVARAPKLAPKDRREDTDLEALAAELHLRLRPLAEDWAARIERVCAWPAELAARRHTLQAWSARDVEAPLELEPPSPESPEHMPLHALVCLGPGTLELERADLRPGKRRAAFVKLEPGDVGLLSGPRRPVVIANTPALQPVTVELKGAGRARLLL